MRPVKTRFLALYLNDWALAQALLKDCELLAYIRLLAAYAQDGAPLPDDDKLLARTARLKLARWLDVRPKLEPMFEVADGVWRDRSQDRAIAMQQNAADRALRGAAARHGLRLIEGADGLRIVRGGRRRV